MISACEINGTSAPDFGSPYCWNAAQHITLRDDKTQASFMLLMLLLLTEKLPEG